MADLDAEMALFEAEMSALDGPAEEESQETPAAEPALPAAPAIPALPVLPSLPAMPGLPGMPAVPPPPPSISAPASTSEAAQTPVPSTPTPAKSPPPAAATSKNFGFISSAPALVTSDEKDNPASTPIDNGDSRKRKHGSIVPTVPLPPGKRAGYSASAFVAKDAATEEEIVDKLDELKKHLPEFQIQEAVRKKKAEAAYPVQDQEPAKPRSTLRAAAGKIWEDKSLAEWPENDHRLFVGDLGNEVNDNTLAKVFVKYTSFAKAKVIRDNKTLKTKGFGFVSFTDQVDCQTALKEMQGCYVGNRPIKLKKSQWDKRAYNMKGAKKKRKNHIY